MRDYLELAWEDHSQVILLDYDLKLAKAISIDNLLARINGGKKEVILSIAEDNQNVININCKQSLITIISALRDFKTLWDTQSVMYDYEQDPYIKMYGVVRLKRANIYCLGLNVLHELPSSRKINSLTLNKAIAASYQIEAFQLTRQTDDMFNFSKFMENKTSADN